MHIFEILFGVLYRVMRTEAKTKRNRTFIVFANINNAQNCLLCYDKKITFS